MSVSNKRVALVALDLPTLPKSDEVAAELSRQFPDSQPLTVTSESETTVFFTQDGATGNYTLVDHPIPWEQLEGPCATAWYWPEATQVMQSHGTHLFITLLDEEGDALDRSLRLTQLLVAIASAADSSVGLVWGASCQVHRPEDFAKLAVTASKADLPLHLWVDFRVIQDDDGQGGQAFGLFTTGLEALGHREFEVTHYPGQPQEMVGAVYNIAHYVLDKNAVLKDGEAIGLPNGAQANVEFSPSITGTEQEVIRLRFEPGPTPE